MYSPQIFYVLVQINVNKIINKYFVLFITTYLICIAQTLEKVSHESLILAYYLIFSHHISIPQHPAWKTNSVAMNYYLFLSGLDNDLLKNSMTGICIKTKLSLVSVYSIMYNGVNTTLTCSNAAWHALFKTQILFSSVSFFKGLAMSSFLLSQYLFRRSNMEKILEG